MPVPIERCDIRTRVRVGKIPHKRKPQHHADARGHHRISPEVKIQPERVGISPHPRERRRDTRIPDRGERVPEILDAVRQQYLHRQSDDKTDQPVLNAVRVYPTPVPDNIAVPDDIRRHRVPRPVRVRRMPRHQLPADPVRKPVAVAHDRPLRHLRKHRKIRRRVDERRGTRNHTAVQIRLIRKHLENVERQPQRKQSRVYRERGNFAADQDAAIQQNGEKQPDRARAPSLPDQPPDEPVRHREKKQQHNKMRFSHGIKDHAAEKENRIPVLCRGDIIQNEKDREETKYKSKAGKNDHSSRVLLPCQLPPALVVPPAVLRPVPEELPDALLLSVFSD